MCVCAKIEDNIATTTAWIKLVYKIYKVKKHYERIPGTKMIRSHYIRCIITAVKSSIKLIPCDRCSTNLAQ